MKKGPIFIVGMNGSGTTMLLDHINNHSLIYGFPEETRVLPYFLEHEADYGDLHDDRNFQRLWEDMASSLAFWRVNGKSPIPYDAWYGRAERSAAEVFDAIMRYFSDKDNKQIWCEKTPMYVQNMKGIRSAYPEARFIHIIRDGRDCAASFHRRWKYNPKRSIARWKDCLRIAARDGECLGSQYLEVSYEQITSDPQKGLKEICDFLQISFEEGMLESSRNMPRMSDNSSKVISRKDTDYHEYFTEKEIEILEGISGRMLYEKGYSVKNSAGDNSLNPFQKLLYRLADDMRVLHSMMQSDKFLNSNRPWKIIVKRIVSSWQLRKSSR